MKSEDEIQAHAAKLIKDWRTDKGMSQADLAAKLGLHQSAVAKIENLDRRIDFPTVVRIADILGIPWESFRKQAPTDLDRFQNALRSYLVGANAFVSEIQARRVTLDAHVQAASALAERLHHLVESGEYPSNNPDAPSVEEVQNSIQEMLGLVARNTPETDTAYEVTVALESLRQLDHILSDLPLPFARLEDNERLVQEWLEKTGPDDSSS